MTINQASQFDFEYLSECANDPMKFAEARDNLIRRCFEISANSQNLKTVQTQLDADRYSLGLGMASCQAHISDMCESVDQLGVLVLKLERELFTLKSGKD